MSLNTLVAKGAAIGKLAPKPKAARTSRIGQPDSRATSDSNAAAPDSTTLLDVLPGHIALLGPKGEILKVNAAWLEFAKQNGGNPGRLGPGLNYLEVCGASSRAGDAEAGKVLPQLRQVLSGEHKSMTLLYPCHSPHQERWFEMQAFFAPQLGGALVVHTDVTARKEAEEALRRSEQHYRALVEISPKAVIVNRDDHVVFANPAALRLFGARESTELIGKPALELFHPQYHEAIRARVTQLKRGESVPLMHEEIVRLDGKVVDVEVAAAPFADPLGPAVQVVLRDISEQMRAHKALQQNEEKLRLALNAAEMGTWVYYFSDNVCSYDEQSQRLYGLSHPDFVHDEAGARDLIHPDDLPAMWRAVKAACDPSGEGKYHAEYRIKRVSGERSRWVRVWGQVEFEQTGAGPRPVRMVGASRDITPFKEAEMALRESEERFREVANGVPAPIWMHGPNGGLQFYNKTYSKFFGLDQNEASGSGWKTLLHPDDAPGYAAAFEASFRTRTEFHAKTRVRRKDGQWRWFESHAQPRFAPTGEFLGMTGVSLDVTEREEFQAELERLVAERTAALKETTDQLNAFVYTLAHDLRAPLRAQSAFATLLLEDFKDALGPTGEGYARRIADAAERQGMLLSDLLKHISLSREDMPVEPVDLATIIKQVQSDLVMDVQQRRAEVHVGYVHEGVCGNSASLHLVVLNLLSNAIKFVAPEKTPKVKIWTQRICDRDKTKWVRLVVEDNGLGIPLELQGKLFGVFQRLHAASLYPGTGIGLAIVKKAAERMGGRVGVDSEPGRGSRFWVDLKPTRD